MGKEESSSIHPRFERCVRLFGAEAMQTLSESSVSVFGLGGVGSYAAEALARTGVGHIRLVDFDRVCVTNINRQLHALQDTIGEYKSELMAEHLRKINPNIKLTVTNAFYEEKTSEEMLTPTPDLVIDCIDNVTAKLHLIAECLRQEIPLVVSLGASARFDPTRIKITKLTETHTDPLGKVVRKFVRKHHGVTDEQMAKVVAVFSDEPITQPTIDDDDVICGIHCMCPNGENPHHTCSDRNIIHGTASFVTASFGMAAASAAVRILLGRDVI